VTSNRVDILPEPLLEFRYGQKLAYPRDGLYLFGPLDAPGQISAIRYGVIGTKDGVRRLKSWAKRIEHFIDVRKPGPRNRRIEPQAVPFPGFSAAFNASWSDDPTSVIRDIDVDELMKALRSSNRHEAVRSAVDIYVDRLKAENNRLERPPAFWFVVVPEFVYELGRPKSQIRREHRLPSTISLSITRARIIQKQPTMFGEEDKDAEIYEYASDFRRQLKDQKRIISFTRNIGLKFAAWSS
jgi:hypothetical protein